MAKTAHHKSIDQLMSVAGQNNNNNNIMGDKLLLNFGAKFQP